MNYFRFFTRNCESIVILFCFNIILIQNNSTQHFKLNSQLNKLKSGIKNGTEVTLKI